MIKLYVRLAYCSIAADLINTIFFLPLLLYTEMRKAKTDPSYSYPFTPKHQYAYSPYCSLCIS